MSSSFWAGRRVLVTGHTGFKGAWLCLLLRELGAEVAGYALEAEPASLFARARLHELVDQGVGDVRDERRLRAAFDQAAPEIVVHMAAQSLVRASYADPVGTFDVNLMGTVRVLDACRDRDGLRAAVVVTSDKCYANTGGRGAFTEADRFGGNDPYSASKGCAELATAAYRQSFFDGAVAAPALASARAGNVIGGGDHGQDRLVPDILRAVGEGRRPRIRNPQAVRPFQHVLDPLRGYLLLAESLCTNPGTHASGYNFGPASDEACDVAWVTDKLCSEWGWHGGWDSDPMPHVHEDSYLALDSHLANRALGWAPIWNMDDSLASIVDWTKSVRRGADPRRVTLEQIRAYLSDLHHEPKQVARA